MQLEAEDLEVKDLQKVGFAVAGLKAEGLYNILQGSGSDQSHIHLLALSCPSSASVCQLQWSQTWQPKSLRLWLQTQKSKSWRGHVGTGDPPSLVSHLIEANIPTAVAPMCINVSDTQWVYCCWVEGCPEGPLSSYAAICAHGHHAHLGTKLTCPFCPVTFINSNALKWHDKQAHCTLFLMP